MLSTSDLVSAAKAAQGISSSYRLARVLGTSDQTLYRWKAGQAAPDDSHAAKLAQMAGLDPGYVIAQMRALREKDPELREIWQSMADRLGALHSLRSHFRGGGNDGGAFDDYEGNGGGEGGSGGASAAPLNPAARAIWMETAELLFRASAAGLDLPCEPASTEGNDPESGPGEGGTSGPKTGALMSMDESHIMRSPAAMTVTRRQARIALARALRALRKARSH